MNSFLFLSFLSISIGLSASAVLEITLNGDLQQQFEHELLNEEWTDWKLKHGKVYDINDENQRKSNFLKNKEIIAEHNIAFHQGLETYSMAMNSFSDLSAEEFSLQYGNGLILNSSAIQDSDYFLPPANVELPAQVDWRKQGAVTSVKDQGHCGSCWAFSAVGALEGQAFRKNKKLVDLSEQELVDCSSSNSGCQGGYPAAAFDDISRIGGLDTESSYPYEGHNANCRFKRDQVGATDKGHVNIRPSEEDLKSAVATVGPISVAVSANSKLQHYHSGVFQGCSPRDKVNHAVLAVGYGSENGQDYWLVKNSWGTQWGDHGYIKIARNKGNMCHIATYGAYPKV